MRSWSELAVSLHGELKHVKQTVTRNEIRRGMQFAANKARSGDPWPGEFAANLQLFEVTVRKAKSLQSRQEAAFRAAYQEALERMRAGQTVRVTQTGPTAFTVYGKKQVQR